MLRLYVPAAVVVALTVVLTFFAWKNQDVFNSSSVDVAEFGKRFANVPMNVPPNNPRWEGTDNIVSKETLEQAGAVSHVSRVYVNKENGKRVDLWLIVGHAREVCRHTPDICNPSQGVAQQGSTIKQRIEIDGDEPATFNTARFHEESFGTPWVRYFWAWNGNRPDSEQDVWEAPDNQKLHFGNNRALYKLYFSAPMVDKEEGVTDSAALEFAKVMLPEINKALFPERYGLTADGEAAADDGPALDADDESDEAPAEEATEDGETADEEAAEPAAAE